MTAGASRTAPDPPNNSSSLTRARPGCATLTSYAGASAAVLAPSPTGGQNWTPIDNLAPLVALLAGLHAVRPTLSVHAEERPGRAPASPLPAILAGLRSHRGPRRSAA